MNINDVLSTFPIHPWNECYLLCVTNVSQYTLLRTIYTYDQAFTLYFQDVCNWHQVCLSQLLLFNTKECKQRIMYVCSECIKLFFSCLSPLLSEIHISLGYFRFSKSKKSVFPVTSNLKELLCFPTCFILKMGTIMVVNSQRNLLQCHFN